MPGVYHVLSHSSRQLKGSRVCELYRQCALTGPVTFLQGTTHPLTPLRVLAACADSAVRVVSPVIGQVLTTALLPLTRRVVSIAYFSFKGEYCVGFKGQYYVGAVWRVHTIPCEVYEVCCVLYRGASCVG